ncbi:MAG: hypothetical protein VSS75_027435 [Candidatus Parabeggiatoa sp.]|nr:hypothetical protein [Candidatus Parabeggiatoa sp.]
MTPEIETQIKGYLADEAKLYQKEKLCPPYCQKRLEYQDQETWLIAAMADILTVSFTGVPINSVAVAVILVTTKRLARFCECSK